MEASTLFNSGNLHYVNEEYEEAVKHYTCAVTLQDCAEHRVCRAAAHLKLGKFTETLEDAEQALAFDPKSHMALHWRGIALFYMGDFGGAKLAFEASQQAAPQAKVNRTLWIRKCEAELSGSTLPLGSVVAGTAKTVAAAPAPTPVAAPVAAPAPAPAAASSAAAAPPAEKAGLSMSGRKQIKREWYQNPSQVVITIFAKGVAQESCKVDFQEKEISVSFPFPGSPDESYTLDLELFDQIDPVASKYEVSTVKVEITLAKKNVGNQWRDLEKQEELPTYTADQPAYPTSNKQKRDWTSIDREIDAEIKAEKPQGDEALNSLFRQIYDRADPETRRAMNKSFQTSGGTVLSTNWGEVGSADYEGKDRPTPPEGQEWRDWTKK